MKKNIYDYLNDVTTPYQEEKLDRETIEQIKTDLNMHKPKSRWKKYTALAGALVLAASIVLTNSTALAQLTEYVESFFTDETVSLSEIDHVPEEIEKYSVNLHETVTLKNMSFVIEDVVMDGDYGYLNLIYPIEYSYSHNEDYEYVYGIHRIYINDEPYMVRTASSQRTDLGNGLVSDYRDLMLDTPVEIEGEFKLGIEFSEFEDDDDKALVELNLSTDVLNADNKIYLTDYHVPDTEGVTINKLLVNPINPRIYLEEPYTNGKQMTKEIIGHNDKGETIVFSFLFYNSEDKNNTMNRGVYEFVAKDHSWRDTTSDFTIKELYELEDTFTFQVYGDIKEKSIFGKTKESAENVEIGSPFEVEFK